MKGKVCMITGSNSGIGKATAIGLAQMGATVVMVCRDRKRAETASAEVKAKSGNESVSLMLTDLSSQKSIHQLAKDFSDSYHHLDVLINNAGVFLTRRSMTVDGIETTFATNHLGPFLLTNLLLDMLKASSPARIVNVSSSAHTRAKVNFDDLQGERHYNGFQAYSQSKLCNILFTYALAKRLSGTGVTVNCFHPGVVRTNLGSGSPGLIPFIFGVMKPFILSPEQGAQTCVYLASSPEVENISGKYFIKKVESRSSDDSYNQDSAEKLQQISTQLTGLA
ncbi:MAG: SDR family oxidoreductase [Nitrososphaerales archaeon]